MASDASNIFDYIVWLVWTILTLTPAALKNPVHDIILTSQGVIAKLMSTSSVEFAPGLLGVLQAATPPSIDFFKSLPSFFKRRRGIYAKRWAVYAIVLEKKLCRAKLYIGVSTHSEHGVRQRFLQYENLENIPKFVNAAMRDGYKITHKGLLAWAPLPTAAAKFPLRVLFLVLETAFSILFWAFYSKTKDYGMPKHLCPWEIDALDYDGCCSHASIGEKVEGEDEFLTAEESEAKAAQKKQQKAQYQKNFLATQKAVRRYECKTCGLAFEAQSNLDMHNLTKKHVDKVRGIAPKVAKNPEYATWANANIAAKKHYCKPCDFTTSTAQKLESHKRSQRHKKRVAEAAGSSLGS
jgi:hypothetical protein